MQHISFEKQGQNLTLAAFEKLTKTKFLATLDFGDAKLLLELSKHCAKLHQKGELSREQVWFGKYYQREIIAQSCPPLSIRWIDDEIGWGVFAERDLKKMDFVCEYTGLLRRRKRADRTNAYCFEYLITQAEESPYVIDALQQGGVSRYINHSTRPNLRSVLATFDSVSHVVLIADGPIAKGTQLVYDYGEAYWKRRPKPLPLI